jgi:hypothetical protein
MRFLSASELIAVWERGINEHPVDRALTLLQACCGESREQLALASLGRRDSMLLQAYAQLFGDTLNAFAECPDCGERLEYDLSARQLMDSAPAADAATELTVAEAGVRLRLRLPNSFDLGAASTCASIDHARRLLAERCVVQAERDGVAVAPASLPEHAVDAISERLAQADQHSEQLIDLSCAACRYEWQIAFEIDRFFWTKISALARRLLRDVHILAQAYGWSEGEILGLSGVRRQWYLEMVS